jgi:transcriptional regulator of acetoin/glycerol metabolism
MARRMIGRERIEQDEALLEAVVVHGVPVRTLAQAMGLTRQSVYRRMQQARINLRRAKAVAAREDEEE